jgi:hypothetical protein
MRPTMLPPDLKASGRRCALLSLAALALLAAVSACRTEVPDEPGAFTFRGRPVHPAAVSVLYRSPGRSVDLAAFETDLEFRSWEDQPGWWIADFASDPVSGKTPFFAYAAFAGPGGGGAETYLLSVTFDAEETGDVGNLILLRKSGGRLDLLRAWDEGAACDGGYFAQRMEGENFLYSRELTPLGLLDLAPGVRFELSAHEDLVYNLALDRDELVSIRLYNEVKADEKGRTEKFRLQSCFNRVFNAYLAEGKTALKPQDVDDFARRFRDECVAPKDPAPTPVGAAEPVVK